MKYLTPKSPSILLVDRNDKIDRNDKCDDKITRYYIFHYITAKVSLDDS